VARLSNLRRNLARQREERRRLLTRGERVFGWSFSVLPPLVVVGAVLLLLTATGAARDVGIGLLLVALLAMVVPVSPVLRARVRRREARALRRE
jgi:ABC-type transport system involved in cytochrome bd biosynthesis fused ATPase/permease subunit